MFQHDVINTDIRSIDYYWIYTNMFRNNSLYIKLNYHMFEYFPEKKILLPLLIMNSYLNSIVRHFLLVCTQGEERLLKNAAIWLIFYGKKKTKKNYEDCHRF